MLFCDVSKNQQIWPDTQNEIYLRRGAQNLKQTTLAEQERLRLNKGLSSFEDTPTNLAIEEIQKTHFDIIFSDLLMPEMNGDDFLNIAAKKTNNSIRIIMSSNEYKLNTNIDFYLKKPFSPEIILNLINDLGNKL